MTTATTDRRARNRRRRERDLQRRRPAPRPSRWSSLPVISGIALVVGAGIIVLAVLVARPGAPSAPASFAPPVAGMFSGLPTDGLALGQADAPVTIDLYEDFQCPACRHWGEAVFPTLAANELKTGQARIVFHDFAFLGPESLIAARAGHAAANQGRFWDMWAAVYAVQGPENSGSLSEARLIELARGLGLDMDRFTADITLAASGPAVDASIAQAHAIGVNSTPTVAINGRLLVGASYDEISAAIADAAPNRR